jgi:ZIP family zinc transporter
MENNQQPSSSYYSPSNNNNNRATKNRNKKMHNSNMLEVHNHILTQQQQQPITTIRMFPFLLFTLVLALTAYSVGVLHAATHQQQQQQLKILHYNSHLQSLKSNINVNIVFCAAWITCAATGLGVVPFILSKRFNTRWVAFGNAVAAGMMLSASMGLVEEGIQGVIISNSNNNYNKINHIEPSVVTSTVDANSNNNDYQYFNSINNNINNFNAEKVFMGFLLGGVFIWQSKMRLDADPTASYHLLQLEGRDAKKVLLIMAVMTLHSMTEGIGIGVSFYNASLGSFISATLAVHNIPEGVAIAVVMLPRGVSKLDTFLWCVASSIPQPLMAVPSYLFVEAFKPIVSVGLGFAAGAMLWVAVFELLPDASEEFNSPGLTLAIASISATLLAIVQVLLREDMSLHSHNNNSNMVGSSYSHYHS